MRYGMPPQDAFNSQWLVRDLRGKSERNFRAYVSLFMRHLCEPGSDNAETYADGVPREGVSRQHVLTRIGIMALIRKKMKEYEETNGPMSMPLSLLEEVVDEPALTEKVTNGLTAAVAAVASATSAAAVGESNEEEKVFTKDEDSSESTKKESVDSIESVKSDEEEISANTPPSENNCELIKRAEEATVKEESTNIEREEEDNLALSAAVPTCEDSNQLTKLKSETVESEDAERSEVTGESAVKTEGQEDDPVVEAKESSPETEAIENGLVDKTSERKVNVELENFRKQKFMFNIADGGFTELHSLWQNEEKVASGREIDIWHRRHDYWLLSGVLKHGYARWQDIQNDDSFVIINQPFKMDINKGNFLEIKNKFLARRFKLLEQALVIEEQLRRASTVTVPAETTANPALSLSNRFSELECLAEANQSLSQEADRGNKNVNTVLHKVLNQLDNLLNEIKGDVGRLPTTLARVPSVSQRLLLSERSILARLVGQSQQQQLQQLQQQQMIQQQQQLHLQQLLQHLTPQQILQLQQISRMQPQELAQLLDEQQMNALIQAGILPGLSTTGNNSNNNVQSA